MNQNRQNNRSNQNNRSSLGNPNYAGIGQGAGFSGLPSLGQQPTAPRQKITMREPEFQGSTEGVQELEDLYNQFGGDVSAYKDYSDRAWDRNRYSLSFNIPSAQEYENYVNFKRQQQEYQAQEEQQEAEQNRYETQMQQYDKQREKLINKVRPQLQEAGVGFLADNLENMDGAELTEALALIQDYKQKTSAAEEINKRNEEAQKSLVEGFDKLEGKISEAEDFVEQSDRSQQIQDYLSQLGERTQGFRGDIDEALRGMGEKYQAGEEEYGAEMGEAKGMLREAGDTSDIMRRLKGIATPIEESVDTSSITKRLEGIGDSLRKAGDAELAEEMTRKAGDTGFVEDMARRVAGIEVPDPTEVNPALNELHADTRQAIVGTEELVSANTAKTEQAAEEAYDRSQGQWDEAKAEQSNMAARDMLVMRQALDGQYNQAKREAIANAKDGNWAATQRVQRIQNAHRQSISNGLSKVLSNTEKLRDQLNQTAAAHMTEAAYRTAQAKMSAYEQENQVNAEMAQLEAMNNQKRASQHLAVEQMKQKASQLMGDLYSQAAQIGLGAKQAQVAAGNLGLGAAQLGLEAEKAATQARLEGARIGLQGEELDLAVAKAATQAKLGAAKVGMEGQQLKTQIAKAYGDLTEAEYQTMFDNIRDLYMAELQGQQAKLAAGQAETEAGMQGQQMISQNLQNIGQLLEQLGSKEFAAQYQLQDWIRSMPIHTVGVGDLAATFTQLMENEQNEQMEEQARRIAEVRMKEQLQEELYPEEETTGGSINVSRSPGNTYRPGQPSAPRNTGWGTQPTQPTQTPETETSPYQGYTEKLKQRQEERASRLQQEQQADLISRIDKEIGRARELEAKAGGTIEAERADLQRRREEWNNIMNSVDRAQRR